MKKTLLLLLVLLATAGMTFAQDIWSCGTHDNGSRTGVGIYQNGERVKTLQHASYDYTPYDITRWNGHTYMAYRNTTLEKAFVYDYEGSSAIDFGANTTVYSVFGRSLLWAVGYRKVGSVNKATAWIISGGNATVEYTYDNGSYDTYAYCGLIAPDTHAYLGGYQITGSDDWHAAVWREGTGLLFEIPQTKSFIRSFAYYDGNLYSLVRTNASNAVWVYKNDQLKYTLTDVSSTTDAQDLYIDGGDIYVCGFVGSQLKVWKNGQLLYTPSGSYLRGVCANSEGVYYCGKSNSLGTIWKDGSVLYQSSDCRQMYELYVETPECANADIRTLPFEEGFETGETDWECWTKIDVDNSNDLAASYWARNGQCTSITSTTPHSGDHYARHTQRPSGSSQEGWLISPRLFLQPGRDYTTMNFYSYVGWTYAPGMASVLVSTDSDPTNLSAYHEVYSLPTSDAHWNQQTVSLRDYQGYAVYIAFKYAANSGANAPSWNIDDVEIYEGWGECSVYALPFYEDFDSQLSDCWYIIDNDHTGGRKCWQYNSSHNCAYHPYGQNNGIKQQGALFSPKIDLSTGSHFKLSFWQFSEYGGSDKANSVWIAVDEPSVPDPANYTQIWSDTEFPSSWNFVEIDLSAYAGHEITLCFVYEGTWAHEWYVDDVSVEETTMWYDINVESNNTAWGSVSGGGSYEEGTSVTIHATPESGYEFVKWTKGGSEVSTNADYTFTVTESATYTAVFGEPATTYYTITTTATPTEGGTVTGGGTFASGTSISLVANPSEGWHFVKWQDNNTDNPREVTVNSDATYTATFAKNQYTITVNASPAAGGSVTGGGTYVYGTNVQLMATAADGYTFLNWSDGVGARVRYINVTENAEYTAYFGESGGTTYTLTVLANDASLGEVSGGGTYPEGASATLTATPLGSAVFQKWDDGDTHNPRTVTVTANATYKAIFVMPTMYTITVVSLNPEMGTVLGGGTFAQGKEITIQAIPNGGYYFNGWDDNNHDNPRKITVTGNATYKAKFSAQQSQTYTLSVMCNPGEGAVTGNGTYAAGTSVTVEAIPYTGYAFDHWNDGVTQNPRTVTVNDNMTLVAFFKKTEVGEYNEAMLSVYPNPTKDNLRLAGIETDATVEIYNNLGMLVKVVNMNTDQEIHVGDLASGLYLIRCGEKTARFIKE